MGARLLAVADTFHAMTSDRPYRDALSAQRAYEEIISLRGKLYDPKVVSVFDRCWKEGVIQRIHQSSQPLSEPAQ